MECKNCGAALSEEAKFCSACGARTDGKAICQNCGDAYEGEECPQCNAQQRKDFTVIASAESAASQNTGINRFDLIKSSVFLIGLLALLTSCFFVGLMCNISIASEVANELNIPEISGEVNSNAFDYLIFQFEEFAEIVHLLEEENVEIGREFFIGGYSAMAVEALTVFANIIIISVCFIMAVIKFAMNVGKREIGIGKYFALAAGAFFFTSVFIQGSAAGVRQTLYELIPLSQQEYFDITVKMNAACIAGLTLLSVVSLVGGGCHIASKEKIFIRNNRYTLIFVPILIIFSGIALILLAGKSLGNSEYCFNIRFLMETLYLKEGLLSASELPEGDLSILHKVYASFVLNEVLLILVSSFLMVLLYRWAEGKSSRIFSFVVAFVSFVLALTYMGLLYVISDAIQSTGLETVYIITAEPIVGTLFILLIYSVTVAYFVLREKKAGAFLPVVKDCRIWEQPNQ
jgi:membrane protein